MKKLYLLTAFLFLTSLATYAGGLRAHMNYSTFFIPGESPYIETYMLVEGNGATFIKNENNKFQATIEVLVLFKQGDKIIEFNKYEFNSPELTDTLNNVHNMINFMDQQRYMLPNGDYKMEFEISDKNTDQKPLKTSQKISVNYADDALSISEIMLIDSYSDAKEQSMLTRGGYNIIPGVFNFYPDSRNELIFYSEVYNADKTLGADQDYLISAFLENAETGLKIEGPGKLSRQKARPVTISLNKFDLSDLPSGNFNIIVEVRDRENNLLATQKEFIQRSNPRKDVAMDGITGAIAANSFIQGSTTLDSLREAVRSLVPRSSNSELMFIRHQAPQADRQSLERFFITFWTERAGSRAAYEWNEYYKLVQYAQKKYSNGTNRGYESGRGYYFCKYGRPDHVIGNRFHNVVYPYEIWHYYDVGEQRDVKFVFYTRDVATRTYELLHSNLMGEVENPHWIENLWRLESQGNANYDTEFQEYMDYYGNKILDEYNSPY